MTAHVAGAGLFNHPLASPSLASCCAVKTSPCYTITLWSAALTQSPTHRAAPGYPGSSIPRDMSIETWLPSHRVAHTLTCAASVRDRCPRACWPAALWMQRARVWCIWPGSASTARPSLTASSTSRRCRTHSTTCASPRSTSTPCPRTVETLPPPTDPPGSSLIAPVGRLSTEHGGCETQSGARSCTRTTRGPTLKPFFGLTRGVARRGADHRRGTHGARLARRVLGRAAVAQGLLRRCGQRLARCVKTPHTQPITQHTWFSVTLRHAPSCTHARPCCTEALSARVCGAETQLPPPRIVPGSVVPNVRSVVPNVRSVLPNVRAKSAARARPSAPRPASAPPARIRDSPSGKPTQPSM